MLRLRGGHAAKRFPIRWPIFAAAFLLLFAILAGGGGAEGSLNNGLIEAGSAIVLLLLVGQYQTGHWPLPSSAGMVIWLLVAWLAVGLAQLIPLSPNLWTSLPGRELAKSAVALTPVRGGWHPLSLDPESTRRAIAALLLPAAIMIAALGATRAEKLLLLRTVIVAALISSIIGALQVTLGYPDLLTFYEGANAGAASGVFANTNHQAALLLSAIVCVGLAIRLGHPEDNRHEHRTRRRFDFGWLLLPFFIVMTLACGSRGGAVLLVIAVPACMVVALGRNSPRVWAAALVLACLMVALVSLLSPSGNAMAIGQSFVFSGDRRSSILPDVLFTLGQYWPAGSGLGTFVPVFAANEDLDLAGRQFVNHAHNDVLEMVIEAGVVGAMLMAVASVTILYRLVSVQFGKRSVGQHQLAGVWAGFFVLALFGLHSLIDYPLRTVAIAAVAGLGLGLVFGRTDENSAVRPFPRGRARVGLVVAGLVGVILGAQVLRLYIAQAAVRSGDGASSAAMRPQSGSALALAAEEQLKAHQHGKARALAFDAISRFPVSARAVRVLATVDDLDTRGGIRAWRVASAMGWRDDLTQYWATQQALANGEWATAAIRADAMMRTPDNSSQDRVGFVRSALVYEPFRKQVLRRLALDPPWEQALFKVSAGSPTQQLQGVYLALYDLARDRSRVDPRNSRETLQVLIERNQYSKAIALYQAVSGKSVAANSKADLGFERSTEDYEGATTPFEWTIKTKGASVASVEQSESKRVLVIGTDGRNNYQPVRRYFVLGAGTYQLRYQMRGAADSPETIGITVRCATGRPLVTSPEESLQGSEFEERQFEFSVPPACELLLVAFESKKTGRPAEAEFTGLSLNGI